MITIAILTWLALEWQLYIMLGKAPSAGISTIKTIINFFSFFTILSNLLVAISLSAVLLTPSSRTGLFFSKITVQSAIAVYIFIVGLVYNLVLRNLWTPTGSQLLVDNLLHLIVPVLYVLYWIIFTPKKTLHWKNIFPWLIFPAIYLVYSLIRGAVVNWYPYPFIDAGTLSYGQLAINSMMVLAAILITGTAMIAFNRYANKKTERLES